MAKIIIIMEPEQPCMKGLGKESKKLSKSSERTLLVLPLPPPTRILLYSFICLFLSLFHPISE